ncbi:hypothetical protein C8N47_1405 [Mangrovibacterium marinum]|uniref:Uncharacterized protein n=1 Tax=Mangrovibacterium marinum TaxID=1639118 RepID=A0A2T5BS98_9BACT|nr:hypothetical protein C8N47_1405 [Mangrovibacterium marinum]
MALTLSGTADADRLKSYPIINIIEISVPILSAPLAKTSALSAVKYKDAKKTQILFPPFCQI